MGVVWEICLRAILILTIVIGISGISIFLLLLFSPNLCRRMSNFCNLRVNLFYRLSYFNKNIPTDSLPYSHNKLFGLALIFGSAFSLIFFFFQLKTPHIPDIINELIINSLVLLGKIASLAGIALGFSLLLAPNKIGHIENIMNIEIDTQSAVERLDEFHNSIDPFFFQHSFIVGSVGLIASIILTILSIINLM
ncbi:hypothetical protein ACFL7E_03555 [Thermodesulfobacteriota bacterium]